jgi:hypothetical protein
MTDTPAASATLRSLFAEKAVLPRKQIAAAEKFISHLKDTIAQGGTPSPEDLSAGRRLLERLQNQTEIFEFNAAILAGQDSASEGDLDRKLRVISNGIDRAQSTSERLRETLKSFA